MEQALFFLDKLLDGIGVTLMVTGCASVLAIVVSVVAGLGRRADHWPGRAAAAAYVHVFRGTSALVQLFWVFFALPMLGVRFDAMTAGIVVLALNTGAYGAEVVRGAIQNVPRGQWEAATALGFSRRQAMVRIILPQAAVAMVPPFGNLLIELLKNSALVSTITLADLTFQGKEILRGEFPAATAQIFAYILVIYFLIAQAIAWGVNRLETKLSAGRDYGGAA